MVDAGDLKSSAARRAGSSPAARTRRGALLALATLAGGCAQPRDERTTTVSVIGGTPRLPDFRNGDASFPERVYADSVAQGLVRFDAAGEIEPGLAARWIVIDDGRTYIFRLRRVRWPDGRAVNAADVAAALRRQIAPRARNPLAPFLTAVKAVRAMTPDVVEIDLARPRPDLLKLFAQPELAITRRAQTGWIGSGPYGPSPSRPDVLSLLPEPDRVRDERQPAQPRIHLRGERASAAILRFRDRGADLALGGTFAEWPLVGLAGVSRAEVRIDPAAGLFGLAVTSRDGFLADAAARAAVAEAIDRPALVAAFTREWAATEQVLPDALDSAAAPAIGTWAAASQADRVADARRVAGEWRRRTGSAPTLRIALPGGPGAARLWARLATDLARAGMRPIRVAPGAPADLRLVDAVAPYDSARWYLATACGACDDTTRAALESARVASMLPTRAAAIATADAALATDIGYIPIARPLRWSLVARRLRGWQPNSRAWHPLNRLTDRPK